MALEGRTSLDEVKSRNEVRIDSTCGKEGATSLCLPQAQTTLAFGVKVAETSRIQGRAQKIERLSVHTPTISTFYYTHKATHKMGLAGQKK